MYEDAKGFGDFISKDKSDKVKRELYTFLKKRLKRHIGNIDTIVAVQRKGLRILDDFFIENPKSKKFNVISNYKANSKLIKDLNVLIFDDSITTTSKISKEINRIKKYSPKRVLLLCVLINDEAIKLLKTNFPKVKKGWYKKFKSQEEQAKEYVNWFLSYIDRFKTNINPDFPVLRIHTLPIEVKIIENIVIAVTKNIVNVENIYHMDSIIDSSNNSNFTIMIKNDSMSWMPKPYNSVIIENDFSKLRCFVNKNKNDTKVDIQPILSPRFSSQNCQMKKYNVGLCKKNDYFEDENLCKICMPTLINNQFLRSLQNVLNTKIDEKNIMITKTSIKLPESGRFFDR